MQALPSPPRPTTPAVLQTLRFLHDPFTLIEHAQRECGDLFALRLLGIGEWVFLCSPALVREMFKAPADILVAGELNAKTLGFMLGLDATFTLDGSAHRERQRIVHPQLNGKLAKQHIGIMQQVTRDAIERWPTGRPFAFLEEAHRISLEVLIHAMFHADQADQKRKLTECFDRYSADGLRSPLVAMPALHLDLGRRSPWGKILHLKKLTREAFAEEMAGRVAQRGQCPAHGDIAHALVHAEQGDGQHLSHASLVDEAINLLFAGHETTGNILAWTLEAVLTHPTVLARLKEELAEVCGDGELSAAHLQELKYFDAVINEAIRYRPIAPMAGVRLVKKAYEIGGHALSEGMVVAQCFPAMTRRRDLFTHPERFDPDHFYGRKLRPFEWNPFGGGTRMCVGRGLAEIELKVVLATLLRRVDFRLQQERVRPVRKGMFFAPSQGLQVSVSRLS